MNDKTATFIDGTIPGKCELCGAVEEVRPYGPGGKFVCFDCGMKDEEEAKRRFHALLEKGPVIIK